MLVSSFNDKEDAKKTDNSVLAVKGCLIRVHVDINSLPPFGSDHQIFIESQFLMPVMSVIGRRRSLRGRSLRSLRSWDGSWGRSRVWWLVSCCGSPRWRRWRQARCNWIIFRRFVSFYLASATLRHIESFLQRTSKVPPLFQFLICSSLAEAKLSFNHFQEEAARPPPRFPNYPLRSSATLQQWGQLMITTMIGDVISSMWERTNEGDIYLYTKAGMCVFVCLWCNFLFVYRQTLAIPILGFFSSPAFVH